MERVRANHDPAAVVGHAYRTKAGELSLRASVLPTILSPCLHPFPVLEGYYEQQIRQDQQVHEKHVELLSSHQAIQTLYQRSRIVDYIRSFFVSQDFVAVETPILAASAGGATARPFNTNAAEFAERKLSLRIAPELWLKRLIVGGMPRLFELGPCFRNEGKHRQ